MKRCLPLPQRYARDQTDHKDRTGNLERKDGGECGYQRADCGADMNPNHYYRFEELSGDFQDDGSTGLDLVETGGGTALTRGASGVDSKCIAIPESDWRSLYAEGEPAHPQYNGGLFSMATGSFGIGAHVWPSSATPGSAPDTGWVPLVGQDSGETTTGDYMGMLWYNWATQEVAVCFNKYQFHTASKDGNPRDQQSNGHFKVGTALLTEDAWNRVLWVHDDTAGGTEKLYINSVTLDSSFASEDGGLVTDEHFRVGSAQWSDFFSAQFFALDAVRCFGGGSKIDNVAAWTPAYGAPTSDDITQFMHGTGPNLAENGTWVVLSGHDVAKIRVKKNGS